MALSSHSRRPEAVSTVARADMARIAADCRALHSAVGSRYPAIDVETIGGTDCGGARWSRTLPDGRRVSCTTGAGRAPLVTPIAYPSSGDDSGLDTVDFDRLARAQRRADIEASQATIAREVQKTHDEWLMDRGGQIRGPARSWLPDHDPTTRGLYRASGGAERPQAPAGHRVRAELARDGDVSRDGWAHPGLVCSVGSVVADPSRSTTWTGEVAVDLVSVPLPDGAKSAVASTSRRGRRTTRGRGRRVK